MNDLAPPRVRLTVALLVGACVAGCASSPPTSEPVERPTATARGTAQPAATPVATATAKPADHACQNAMFDESGKVVTATMGDIGMCEGQPGDPGPASACAKAHPGTVAIMVSDPKESAALLGRCGCVQLQSADKDVVFHACCPAVVGGVKVCVE